MPGRALPGRDRASPSRRARGRRGRRRPPARVPALARSGALSPRRSAAPGPTLGIPMVLESLRPSPYQIRVGGSVRRPPSLCGRGHPGGVALCAASSQRLLPQTAVVTDFEAWSEKDVIRILLTRGVVPLLGAGVNKSGRPAGFEWKYDPLRGEHPRSTLRTGSGARELPGDVFQRSAGSGEDRGPDPYLAVHRLGQDERPRALRNVERHLRGRIRPRAGAPVLRADREAPPRTRAAPGDPDHELRRPARARPRAAGEQYDLITYIASGPQEYRGRFMHWAPGEPPKIIEGGNSYSPGGGEADGDRQAPRRHSARAVTGAAAQRERVLLQTKERRRSRGAA